MKKYNSISKFWSGMSDNQPIAYKNGSSRDLSIIEMNRLIKLRVAISRFVNIVTNKPIHVTFAGGDNSYTDGQTVTISAEVSTPELLDVSVGVALHEASHIQYTDFSIFDVKEQYKHLKEADVEKIPLSKRIFYDKVSFLGFNSNLDVTEDDLYAIKQLHNWVEDRRIDNLIMTYAPGYVGYYDALYDHYFRNKEISSLIKSEPDLRKQTQQAYFFHIFNFINEDRDLTALPDLDTIYNIIDLENISRLNDTTDALRVACEIWDVVKKHIDGPDPVNQKPHGLSDWQRVLRELYDLLDGKQFKVKLSSGVEKILKKFESSGARVYEYESENGGMYSTIVYKNLTPSNISMVQFSTNHDHKKIIKNGELLGLKLGKQLRARNQRKEIKFNQQNSGKVDRRRIFAAGMSESRIFQKIQYDVTRNFLIHISIDNSGSMSDDTKFNNAMISAYAIAKASSMTEGIRVQISLRHAQTSSQHYSEDMITSYIYDSAKMSLAQLKNILKSVSPKGLTPEGLCLNDVMKEIQQDVTDEHVIFVNYSDGEPYTASVSSSVIETKTTETIDKMRKNGWSVFSYFIESADALYVSEEASNIFKRMYGNDSKFVNPLDMTQVAKSLNAKFLETDSIIK